MTPVRVIRKPGHPLAHHDGRIREHRYVLYEKIGSGTHSCHWCGREVQWMAGGVQAFRDRRYLVPDHLDSNPLNNSPENLEPSCVPCNSARSKGGRANQILRDILARPNRRGLVPKKYKRVSMPDHPMADGQGCVQEHVLVLYRRIGPGQHKCHWCGCPISWDAPSGSKDPRRLVADHLDGVKVHNADDNLVPACSPCNVMRGRPDRVLDSEVFVTKGKARFRAEERHCRWCTKKFMIKTSQLKSRPGTDGQFCSRSCTMSATLAKQHGHTADTLFGHSKAGKKFKAERRTCKECKTDFLFSVSMGPHTSGEFCSRSCSSKYNNRAGKIGNRLPSDVPSIPNRSWPGGRLAAIELPCKWCGVGFLSQAKTNRQFCSHRCAAKFRRANSAESHF